MTTRSDPTYGNQSGWEYHRYYVFVDQVYDHLNPNQRVVPSVLAYVMLIGLTYLV